MAGDRTVRLGLIGLGRWGTNYARAMGSVDGVILSAVSTRGRHREGCDGVRHVSDWRRLLDMKDIDGVVVAAPPGTHYEMGSAFLSSGIPVVLEKPACYRVQECEDLARLSLENGAPCVVGYTHLYAPAYRSLKDRLPDAGGPTLIRSIGVSEGPFRDDVPVLWDWGSHDVAMCIDTLGESPTDVAVRLEEVDPERAHACIYSLDLGFPSGARSSSRFGNVADTKRRSFSVHRGDYQGSYDGLSHQLSEETGGEVNRFGFGSFPSPLETLVHEFACSIRGGVGYHQSINLAVEVTKVLSVAGDIVNQRGKA